MTDIQQRFVEEYCKDCKGAKAAVRAGYSLKSAKDIAYQLKRDPEIIEAIKHRLREKSMSAEEAQKRISDMGKTRLNDYMTVEEVWETTWEKKPLKALIDELQLQIDIDEEFIERAGLTEQEEDKLFDLNKQREREIIRYQIELEKNPKAYRILKSEPRPVKKANVDLIKLAKADEEGAIKKLSFNERGLPSVEMYAADSALKTTLELHGKVINKHDHSSSDGSMSPKSLQIDPSTLTEEQLNTLLDVIQNVPEAD